MHPEVVKNVRTLAAEYKRKLSDLMVSGQFDNMISALTISQVFLTTLPRLLHTCQWHEVFMQCPHTLLTSPLIKIDPVSQTDRTFSIF